MVANALMPKYAVVAPHAAAALVKFTASPKRVAAEAVIHIDDGLGRALPIVDRTEYRVGFS